MPFTPFHAGIALLLWALAPLDVLALLLGALLSDLEALLFFSGVTTTAHGALHSLLGAALLAIPVAALSFSARERLGMPLPVKIIILSALLGTFSHLLLDALTVHGTDYGEIIAGLPGEAPKPINIAWPFGYWNPIYGLASPQQTYLFSTVSLLAALFIKRKQIVTRLRRFS